MTNSQILAAAFGYDSKPEVVVNSVSRKAVTDRGSFVKGGYDAHISLSEGYKAIEDEIERACNLAGNRYNVRVGRWYNEGPLPTHVRISFVHIK